MNSCSWLQGLKGKTRHTVLAERCMCSSVVRKLVHYSIKRCKQYCEIGSAYLLSF